MGELGARRRTAAMASTTMARRPLPWFQLRQWRVSEVEEVMVEWCVRAITQWHGGGGVRARWSSAMVMAVLGFATTGVRASETERVRVESERPASSHF